MIINKNNPSVKKVTGIVSKTNIGFKKVFNNSSLIKQIKEKRPDLNPLHFLVTFLGMTIFPFVAKPVFRAFDIIQEEEFLDFINERKKLIPIWIKTFLNT